MNPKDETDVSAFYDADAATYDESRWRSTMGRWTAEVQRDIFEDLLGKGSFTRGLEVGCGTGRFTAEWAPSAAEVVLADISPEMLNLTTRRLAALGIASVSHQAESHQIPLADASVDLIVCLNVLNHVSKFDETVAEFARLLRPGGRAIINYASSHGVFAPAAALVHRRRRAIGQDVYSAWRSPAEVEGVLERAGLVVTAEFGHVHAPRALYRLGPIASGPLRVLDRASRTAAQGIASCRFISLTHA